MHTSCQVLMWHDVAHLIKTEKLSVASQVVCPQFPQFFFLFFARKGQSIEGLFWVTTITSTTSTTKTKPLCLFELPLFEPISYCICKIRLKHLFSKVFLAFSWSCLIEYKYYASLKVISGRSQLKYKHWWLDQLLRKLKFKTITSSNSNYDCYTWGSPVNISLSSTSSMHMTSAAHRSRTWNIMLVTVITMKTRRTRTGFTCAILLRSTVTNSVHTCAC